MTVAVPGIVTGFEEAPLLPDWLLPDTVSVSAVAG